MIAIVILGSLAVFWLRGRSGNQPILNTTSVDSAIAKFPQKAAAHPHARLAPGLLPPTNKWFSSLAFAETPQPVFAYPLSFKPAVSGFEASYPAITGTPETLTAPHVPAVTVGLGSTDFTVKQYDDLSVTLSFTGPEQAPMAEARITHGSPFVFVTTIKPISVSFSYRETAQRINDHYYVVTYAGKRHGIYAGAPITQQRGQLQIQAGPGSQFAVFALPDSGDIRAFEVYAQRPITNTSVSYAKSRGHLTTNLTLKTQGSLPTLLAAMPHQRISKAGRPLGTYDTLYGKLNMHEGSTFNYQHDTPKLDERLPLGTLSKTEKDELKTLVQQDIATALVKPDTYYGGKELQRAANLLVLANQLGMAGEKQRLMESLRASLEDWLSTDGQAAGRFFAYDTVLRGVVGYEPSFGSEQFNDHNFHYGYFIYAAAVLARHDDSFAARHGDVIDALVADIASPTETKTLPKLRVFDPYVGHSWASGYGEFADGNNQESVSEAVNAWYALFLWGKVRHNDALVTHAEWLYSHESQAAVRYWLTNNKAYPAYTAPNTTIVWGGKRDYATWFSTRPQAKLGILLLPMSPGHTYLENSTTQAPALIAAAVPSPEQIHGPFGDYLTMYRAVYDKQGAIAQARTLEPNDIDDGNSRAYMMAWIYTRPSAK